MRLIEAATGWPRATRIARLRTLQLSSTKAKRPRRDPGEIIAVVRRVLSENGRDYLPQYLFAIGCLLAIAATTAFSAWIMRDVVDEIFYRRRADLIAVICGAIALAFVIRGVALYGQAVVLAKIGNNLVARYQQRLFDHLMKLGVGYLLGDPLGASGRADQPERQRHPRPARPDHHFRCTRRGIVAGAGRRDALAGLDPVGDRAADRSAAGLYRQLSDAAAEAHHARIGRGELAADRRHAGGDARHHHRQGLHHGGRAFGQAGGADRPCRGAGQQDRSGQRAAVADRRDAGRLRRCRRHRLCRLSRALRQPAARRGVLLHHRAAARL